MSRSTQRPSVLLVEDSEDDAFFFLRALRLAGTAGPVTHVADGGLAIHYVEGNRDFFIQGSFAEAAVTDVAHEYTVEAGNRKYLIVHGDLINERDYPYRFWRSVSKHRGSKAALRFVPGKVARRLVHSVEQRLSRSCRPSEVAVVFRMPAFRSV